MWLFLNNAYLSIVADRNTDQLLVRSRIPGDIERIFPNAEVLHTPSHDYPYRAFLARETVAVALAREALSIDYTNFKNSVPDHRRHEAYFGVYNVMARGYSHAHHPDEQPLLLATEQSAPPYRGAYAADFVPPAVRRRRPRQEP